MQLRLHDMLAPWGEHVVHVVGGQALHMVVVAVVEHGVYFISDEDQRVGVAARD